MFKMFKAATDDQLKAIYEIHEILNVLIKVSCAGLDSWQLQEGYQVFTNGAKKNLPKAITLRKEIEEASSNLSQATFQRMLKQFRDCSEWLLGFAMDTLASATVNPIVQDMFKKYFQTGDDPNESIITIYGFLHRNFSTIDPINAVIYQESIQARLDKLEEKQR